MCGFHILKINLYICVYVYNTKLNSIRDKQYAKPITYIISLNSHGYPVLVLCSPPFIPIL